MRADMDAADAQGADAVECRLDMLNSPPTEDELEVLLRKCPLETIVTNRPADEGGQFQGNPSQQLKVLHDAAECHPAFIDLEMDVPADDWPLHTPIILSHHDFKSCPNNLEVLISRLDASNAQVNKIAFMPDKAEDVVRAFDVLRACRKPTIAIAMGEAGIISRVLAGKFCAFGTFAALRKGSESAPGQLTLDELKSLYRWEAIGADTKVYALIGSPVAHSLSPAVHNAAFAAAGIDAVYLPVRVEGGKENFGGFMDALLARPWMDWHGLSITLPHKLNALDYVGEDNCDELACRIGAINTITIGRDGQLRGYNTDYAAAMDALCGAMDIAQKALAGRSVAVIGAGGVSRAIVAALANVKADVTIYNRTAERGEKLAEEFSCRARPLDALAKTDAEILINCTSIGMHPDVDASPLDGIPPDVGVVFDTIYNPPGTRLLRQAKDSGCQTVSGLDMFVNQAAAQFELWTGAAAPKEIMREAAAERLRHNSGQ